MADAALEFLLQSLRHLLLNEARMIKDDVKNQVEKLERDLLRLRFFLKESTTKQRKDDAIIQELVRQATNVIYEAEDVVDSFVAHYVLRNYVLRAFLKHWERRRFSEQVGNVRTKVTNICSGKAKLDFGSLGIDEEHDKENIEGALVRQDNIVGFEDEMRALLGYLIEETEQLDVITIAGMPGIGKTTLAKKIYNKPEIKNRFRVRIWIHVSNNFTEKDILLAILKELMKHRDDLSRLSIEELAQLAVENLKRENFLIVMDDVRSIDDWDKFKISLPKFNKFGKVLITTCNEEVGRHANRVRLPFKVPYLTQEESWSLLQLEVFGRHDRCPEELENIGKLIAKQCEGLPLAVVVMGSILARKDNLSSNMAARKTEWIKACQDVPKYHNKKFYDDLPKHLQVCFLYFGMFPPDFEIPVWKLICLWIAEGFISKQRGVSLEETGENYLDHLINRNLVVVDQIRANGKVKTCRIHPMLHGFCKIQAGKENVLEEIKFIDGVFEPRISELPLYRRLCIHSNVSSFLCSKPFGPRVRSLVSFSSDEVDLPPESNSAIPPAFKLLRVLDVRPIKFSKIPSDMYQLVHLRYLTLSISLNVLPFGFSKLRNIQSFIVYTTSRTLEIKADIWKLAELRQFKINAIANLPKASKTRQEAGQNLQALGTISTQSCTEENFGMARSLKRLGIRGRLSLFFDGMEGSFDCLGRLTYLEKLKLINDVFHLSPLGGRVHSLPPAYKFPPRLRSLTLCETYLDWGQMLILGSLEKLEVLKLKDNALKGHNWVTDDGGFHNLEALHIGRTDLVIWVASAYHFPKLRHLELHNCEKLQEVPIELADIPSFQRLELYRTKLAAASANRILERKQKYLEGRKTKIEHSSSPFFLQINDCSHTY